MRTAIWPVLYAAHALCFVGALLDDAFISFRYASNVERGLGLVFNVGEHVEGYTNFLWVCLAALGLRVGLDLTWTMPALAFVAGIALTYLVAQAARSLAREQTTLAGFGVGYSAPFRIYPLALFW